MELRFKRTDESAFDNQRIIADYVFFFFFFCITRIGERNIISTRVIRVEEMQNLSFTEPRRQPTSAICQRQDHRAKDTAGIKEQRLRATDAYCDREARPFV